LKKLILNGNRLVTLPDILHLLPELEVRRVRGREYYYIDGNFCGMHILAYFGP
jgi:hypothetical protein